MMITSQKSITHCDLESGRRLPVARVKRPATVQCGPSRTSTGKRWLSGYSLSLRYTWKILASNYAVAAMRCKSEPSHGFQSTSMIHLQENKNPFFDFGYKLLPNIHPSPRHCYSLITGPRTSFGSGLRDEM